MGLYGIFMLTCWKPSKLPLRPTSFGELSMATLVHSLPSDFQKTPRANMRIIIGRGSGLGLGWYPYIAKIFPLKKRAAQEERKQRRIGTATTEERDTTLCLESLLKIRSVLQNNSGAAWRQYPVLREREAGGCLRRTFGRILG